jgi:hypothetical protein
LFVIGVENREEEKEVFEWFPCNRERKQGRMSHLKGDMSEGVEGTRQERMKERLAWLFVSALDPSLGAVLDRPTCSPASPIITRNDQSKLYKYQ